MSCSPRYEIFHKLGFEKGTARSFTEQAEQYAASASVAALLGRARTFHKG
jgi:hypothetical protein